MNEDVKRILDDYSRARDLGLGYVEMSQAILCAHSNEITLSRAIELLRELALRAADRAVANERAAVVAYLRTLDDRWGLGASVCGAAADEIERGEHRKEKA
jgi:hypothetical protein